MYKKFASIFMMLLCSCSPAPLWVPVFCMIKKTETEFEISNPPERSEEVELLELIDNFEQRKVNYYNKHWRDDLLDKISNPEHKKEQSTLFAATINSMAKSNGQKYRIQQSSVNEGIMLDTEEDKKSWAALTGKYLSNKKVDEELSNVLEHGEYDESLDEIIADLPPGCTVPRSYLKDPL